MVLLAGVLAAAAAAGMLWFGLRSLDEPLNVGAPLRFTVIPGTSFAHVAADLAAQGLIAQPRAWVLYARWKGLASGIKAGEYEIEPGITPRALLSKMVSGQVVLHSFTIIDGWRVQDLLLALRRNPDVAHTVSASPSGLMEKLGVADKDAEGQFLPETYRFPGGTTDVELLRQARVPDGLVADFPQVLEGLLVGRDVSFLRRGASLFPCHAPSMTTGGCHVKGGLSL